MEFKDILKSQRLAHGFTQEELGKLVGLQKAAIYKYENGLLINPKQSLIKKLADVFGVSPAYMLGVDDSVDAQDSYYTDPATLAMAQALHDNPQYRVMFDSTRDMKPEDVQKVIDFIRWQRHQEGYDDD
ncbi:MAG: helix-turn-helix transcriptional regulator [Succiniclasticum sp.]|nr:helix-turn-helix transcriptional regulator [Succiniclasticum sp.]